MKSCCSEEEKSVANGSSPSVEGKTIYFDAKDNPSSQKYKIPSKGGKLRQDYDDTIDLRQLFGEGAVTNTFKSGKWGL